MPALPHNDTAIRDILTRCRNIALLGASDKPARPANEVMAFLLAHGYRVFPVNPRLAGSHIHGQMVYADLADIPEPIDMIDLFVNTQIAESQAATLLQHPAPVLWLQLGVISGLIAEQGAALGKQVVMDRCPKIEIQRLGIVGPTK